jgi:hypothetical protein
MMVDLHLKKGPMYPVEGWVRPSSRVHLLGNAVELLNEFRIGFNTSFEP